MTFQVGDVVKFNSGGPDMTVVQLNYKGDVIDSYAIHWFQNGVLLTGRYKAECLTPVRRAGEASGPCTCHPDDNPPVPCPQRFALSECKAVAAPPAFEKGQRVRLKAEWAREHNKPHEITVDYNDGHCVFGKDANNGERSWYLDRVEPVPPTPATPPVFKKGDRVRVKAEWASEYDKPHEMIVDKCDYFCVHGKDINGRERGVYLDRVEPVPPVAVPAVGPGIKYRDWVTNSRWPEVGAAEAMVLDGGTVIVRFADGKAGTWRLSDCVPSPPGAIPPAPCPDPTATATAGVKVGGWVTLRNNSVLGPAKVRKTDGCLVKVDYPDGDNGTWPLAQCIPCDPPAPEPLKVGEEVTFMGQVVPGLKVRQVYPNGTLYTHNGQEQQDPDYISVHAKFSHFARVRKAGE